MAEERLPPFPDELLVAEKKEQVIAFLRGQGLPSRIASWHLLRWAQVVGLSLTREDVARVRSDLSPTPAE